MSKNVIIPYGKCLDLSNNITGVSKIDKVNFSQINLSLTQTSISYDYKYADWFEGNSHSYIEYETTTRFSEETYAHKSKTTLIGTLTWSFYAIKAERIITPPDTVYFDIVGVNGVNCNYAEKIYERAYTTRSSNSYNKLLFYTRVDNATFDNYWENIESMQNTSGRFYTIINNDDGSKLIKIIHLYRFNYTNSPPYDESQLYAAETCFLDETISVMYKYYSENSSSDVNGDGKNEYSMNYNNFMNVNTNYRGIPITTYNSNAILNNYFKKAQIVDAKIVTANYYDENGTLLIDKSKGEIVDIGDEVKFVSNDKEIYSDKWFRVVSSEFTYNGVPGVSLVCKEIIKVPTWAFKVNLTNPEYMTVSYSYIDSTGNVVQGNITQTTTFNDIKAGETITITATPLSSTAQYTYSVSSNGGTYDSSTTEISINATRTINQYNVVVGIKYQDTVITSQTIRVDYGTIVNSADYYNDDTYTTTNYIYTGKTTNQITVSSDSSVYTTYSTRSERTYSYQIRVFVVPNESPVETYRGSAAYGTQIAVIDIYGSTYTRGNYEYYNRSGAEYVTIIGDGQVVDVYYSNRKPNTMLTIPSTYINRGDNVQVVSSNAFAYYNGDISIYGRFRAHIGDDVYYYIGNESGAERVTLHYNSVYNNWSVTLYDEPVDPEGDYDLGYAEVILDETGIRVEWDTDSQYAYDIDKIWITGQIAAI